MRIKNSQHIHRRHERWPKRSLAAIREIVVHRFSLKGISHEKLTADEVADFFEREPMWVGVRMPYHFVIRTDGTIEQALPLGVVGHHASGRNRNSVGIAVIGDFTKKMPTKAQESSLYILCRVIKDKIGQEAKITRHRPMNDPDKDCPGKLFDLEGILAIGDILE